MSLIILDIHHHLQILYVSQEELWNVCIPNQKTNLVCAQKQTEHNNSVIIKRQKTQQNTVHSMWSPNFPNESKFKDLASSFMLCKLISFSPIMKQKAIQANGYFQVNWNSNRKLPKQIER